MIEIVFFTSSAIKLAHARHLCRDYDVLITGFREKTFGANYNEPRISNRDELIKRSFDDALQRWKKAVHLGENKLFFIEDTSVVIDALSAEKEVPGLDIKYWMAEMDFTLLDAMLKEADNNRRATVRSDLVLHLPVELQSQSAKNYLCFTSTLNGSVVEREQPFNTNLMYPWLDNKTFNKWFVPEGCSQPVGMLPIAEADRHDFRAKAFRDMLAFLEQRQKIVRRSEPTIQQSLESDVPLFVICGPSCAGKTTLAEHLAERYGYYHIEASDFMYLSFYQRHGVASAVNIGDFAEQALRDQPEIVAEQILFNIQKNSQVPVVVTGFRSPKELEWFQRYYTGFYSITVIFVVAQQSVRYERSIIRQREDHSGSREQFDQRDAQQLSMGLDMLENSTIAEKLENNADLESFFNNFDKRYLLDSQRDCLKDKSGPLILGRLEGLILQTLADKWSSREYFTTTEIAHMLNQSVAVGKIKSKNNVSRYFNQRFYPYFDIKLVDGKKKYRLSNTGYGMARLLVPMNKNSG